MTHFCPLLAFPSPPDRIKLSIYQSKLKTVKKDHEKLKSITDTLLAQLSISETTLAPQGCLL